MHLYWRVMEELRFLGEIVVILDPPLRREFESWRRRNAAALACADGTIGRIGPFAVVSGPN